MGALADGFVSFAQPLIDQTDGSEDQLNKAFAISQLCFNLAISPTDRRDQMLSELRHTFSMDDEEFASFRRDVIVPMIQRHEQMFPLMHGRSFTANERSLGSQQVRPRVATPAEKRTTNDRYAPCLCNSGKKYKFCCGLKGR